MNDLVFSLQEFLKIVPGIVIFPLSFYLAYKKIGASVSCSISYSISRVSANQFKDIVLANNKDKPITIFEIRAVINKDITFSVEEFNPPIILKPLETISISAKPYSSLYIEERQWEPKLFSDGQIDIYLSTPAGIIKCKRIPHPSTTAFKKLSHLNHAAKVTKKFNGIVYSDEKAAYAITYKSGTDIKTAIIDVSGFITGDWDYKYNQVKPEHMISVEGIREFIKISKADLVFTIYGVDRLE